MSISLLRLYFWRFVQGQRALWEGWVTGWRDCEREIIVVSVRREGIASC